MTKKDFNGQYPEEASSSCSSNESSNELHLRKGTKRSRSRKGTKRSRSMEDSSDMKFLERGSRSTVKFVELLTEVCKGTEQSIESPEHPQHPLFWSLFSIKFNQILQEQWSPGYCETFATKLGIQYLNKDKNQFSSNFRKLLELVFVDNANLFPAFAATQKDPDVVRETPPDNWNPGKLVKRPEGTTSSVRNISQSEGSSLPEEVETDIRNTILLMAHNNMLTIQQIEFAQNSLTRSTWAAQAFLNKSDMESKRDFILESMATQEGLENNKKKKRM
ncbi:hypothetical protein CTI12_AA375860 [Artemisia annua]|uniref:Uncharacterized protein n=1 Tax=Artemisia annua TaxID=35608 RepID=A0A2U1MIJ8_ARTAN|nr:hypothetical protein CTI12_AA375860 [Artemisia annua]